MSMTKKQMVDYITSHTKRMYLMNSWNNLWVWGINVKIHSLPLSTDERNKAYELMDAENFYDNFNIILSQFNIIHPELYTFFNGRSAGWLCLAKSGKNAGQMQYYYDADELAEMDRRDVSLVYADIRLFVGLLEDLLTELKYMTASCKVKEVDRIIHKTIKQIDCC